MTIINSFSIHLNEEAHGFLVAYCKRNDKSLNEALEVALKLLKVADDARCRGENIGIIKGADKINCVTEVIYGY